MKTCRMISAILIVLVFSMGPVSRVKAVPPLPSSFYGTVNVAGSPVVEGTQVTAWINGVQYAVAAVELDGDAPVYAMDVPGDDPETVPVEGGTNGVQVIFKIGDQTASPTASWQSGVPVELDLSAGNMLNVTLNGTGSGMVSSSPEGISCGTACSAVFEINASITLTATPAAGSIFSRWGGACSGSGNCEVIMDQARLVSAEFNLIENASHLIYLPVVLR